MSVPVPKFAGKWLDFNSLSNLAGVSDVLALAWRLTDDGTEPWTARLNKFEAGQAPAVRGACAVVTAALATVQFDENRVVVVSALPSAAKILSVGSHLVPGEL